MDTTTAAAATPLTRLRDCRTNLEALFRELAGKPEHHPAAAIRPGRDPRLNRGGARQGAFSFGSKAAGERCV